jgi:hypothetical protein
MKFVSALGWMLLGICLGAMLSRAISGPYPVPSHAYAERHADAAKAMAHPLLAEIDSSSSHQE